VAVEIHIQNVNSDGFEVTKGGFGASSLVHHFLCLGGIQARTGYFEAKAAGVTVDLGLSFDPNVLLVASCRDFTSAGGVGGAYVAMGGWLSNGTVRSVMAHAEPLSGVSLTAVDNSEVSVLRQVIPDATGSLSVVAADLEVVDEGHGIKFTVSGGASTRVYYFLALTMNPIVIPGCSGGTVPQSSNPYGGVEFQGLGPHEDRLFIELDLD
jgi:hypothetical protein